MPRKPETTWEMLDHALQYYKTYIDNKKDKYVLSVIDLIFISNFKGGNASITEPEQSLSRKIEKYGTQLKAIAKKFKERTLEQLNEEELSDLVNLGNNYLAIAKNKETKIRGFGVSYASALLSAYFGDLYPVVDRRILNGSGIEVEYDSQKQVKTIEKHYEALIRKCHAELKAQPSKTLRELDKEWFVKNF